MIRTLVHLAERAGTIIDGVERWIRPDMDLPPYSMRRLVGSPATDLSGKSFRAEGDRWFKHLVNHAAFTPTCRVLDIGCGCGRMSRAVARRLHPAGQLVGFDVRADLVHWAVRTCTAPNAQFFTVDVLHDRYHPTGSLEAQTFRFPFEDERFDIAFAASVFTHMLPAQTDNYLAEIARVLAREGRCLASFFLLDVEHPRPRPATIDRARRLVRFDGAFVRYPALPGFIVAYSLEQLRTMSARRGLKIDLVVAGSWRYGGSADCVQDLCVLTHA